MPHSRSATRTSLGREPRGEPSHWSSPSPCRQFPKRCPWQEAAEACERGLPRERPFAWKLAVNPATGVRLHLAGNFRNGALGRKQQKHVNVVAGSVDEQSGATKLVNNATHVGKQAWFQFRVQ